MIPALTVTYSNIRSWSNQNTEPHITKDNLEKILREWESHALPGEKRQKAVEEILAFYNKETAIITCSGKGDLDFCNYKLRSLPDIFSYLPFRCLRGIEAAGCFLQQLPDSFSHLEELIFLDLEWNEFEEVPAGISSLRKLKELDLSHNKLAQLPDNLDLPYLEILNLEQNAFVEFPGVISRLRSLLSLDISGNTLTTLPQPFHWPKNLNVVNLGVNKLSSLPEELCELRELFDLYLFRNEFTHISSWISKFSNNVCIDVNRNPLPEEEVQRVLQITNSPSYSGPVIEGLSIESESESETDREEEVYDKLHTIADLPPQSFANLPHSDKLQTWLNRLFKMADLKEEKNKKTIAQKVLSILKVANDNKEYRQVFLSVLEEASETCGDRIALSILHLDLAYQTREVELTNMDALAHLLIRGVWIVDLLEKQAREKIATLRGVDEIETYLAYPIKLKEKLQIPITLEAMRYFDCSALTNEDIEKAYEQVINQISCRDAYLTFLSKQDLWQRAISLNYPQEWKQIEKEKEQAMEQAHTPEDYLKVQEEFIAKIKALSDIIYKEPQYKSSLSGGLEGTSRQYPSLEAPDLVSGLNASQASSSQEPALKRELEVSKSSSEEASKKEKKIRLDETYYSPS